MSAPNNTEGDQKLESKEKTDEELRELLVWPPKDYKDDFTPPKLWLKKLTNTLQRAICKLNTAPTLEQASDPKYQESVVPAVFFSARRNEVLPEQGRVNEADYMIFHIPDNRGLAKIALIHQTTAKYISEVREAHGNVILKFHTIPHPTEHSVFTISELYLMPPGSEATLLTIALDKKCHYCGTKNAIGTCKCEQVNFCSPMCRQRAVQSGRHSEVECTLLMRKSVMTTAKEARIIIGEYKKIVDADIAAMAEQAKRDVEKQARVKAVLEKVKAEQATPKVDEPVRNPEEPTPGWETVVKEKK